jgi:hypothetical protein
MALALVGESKTGGAATSRHPRIPDIARIERDGFLILPPGWAASFEHRLAAMVAYILDLPVTYESGRPVHRNRLVRGMLGNRPVR